MNVTFITEEEVVDLVERVATEITDKGTVTCKTDIERRILSEILYFYLNDLRYGK